MKALSISLAVVMLAAMAYADKKGDPKFSPGPALSYPAKQTNENVTVAAVAYDSDELAHTAFGKLNPYQYGVLPVLVIIQNDTGEALRLDAIVAEFVDAAGRHAEATPAADVPYAGPGPSRPKGPSGIHIPPGMIKHKNPLSAWEIE